MEPVGLVSDASWSSFDPPVPVDESEVMEQFFGSHNFANEQDQDPSTLFWPDHNADSYYCSANSSYSSYYWSQGNCTFMPGNYESFSLVEPPRMIPVDSHHRFGEPSCANEEASSDEVVESIAKPLLHIAHGSQATKRKMHVGDVEEAREDSDNQMGTKPQKTARVTKKGNNAKPKKAQRSAGAATEDESNASYSYSSEDDSNGSQELKEVGGMSSSLNQNGKKRAGRGSATDPQSLYARKRRERINERLKVLQKLVPNGTKVDISTMLEEAVQYVKFLQFQIKLLSSDELWMYAPIAYNGMNLGFNLNIPK